MGRARRAIPGTGRVGPSVTSTHAATAPLQQPSSAGLAATPSPPVRDVGSRLADQPEKADLGRGVQQDAVDARNDLGHTRVR